MENTLTTQQIALTIARITAGVQSVLHVADLSAASGFDADTSIRDLLRMCFYELGIEIEFSGKGTNEKGVVIDMDEEKLLALGLNADILRFGQTVVRVSTEHADGNEVYAKEGLENQSLSQLMMSSLDKVKAGIANTN